MPVDEALLKATALSAAGDLAVLLTPAGVVTIDPSGAASARSPLPGGPDGAVLAHANRSR